MACTLCNKKNIMQSTAYLDEKLFPGVEVCMNCRNKYDKYKDNATSREDFDRITAEFVEYKNATSDDSVKDIIETVLQMYGRTYEEFRGIKEEIQLTKQERERKVATVIADAKNNLYEYLKIKAQEDICIYDVPGCRGRNIKVFDDRVIIKTDVTLGSILTNNATDGEKTIFYQDVIGVQYKEPGMTIGYLQLETASGQMNNLSSNAFSENTFTYEVLTDEIVEMKEYVLWQVSKRKK